jgi:phosphoribosylanthranilate isomerase
VTFLAKVCGLTRAGDAAQAAEAGADLLGFVCHPPSPRHCADLAIAAAHPDRAVLVMVAGAAEAVLDTARAFGFRRVQPHLPPAERLRGALLLRQAGLFVILPWADEPGQTPVPADLYLWEPSPAATGVAGGSGQGHGMAFPPPGPTLLAGGLVGGILGERAALLAPEARRHLRGFDAASRLESAPGRKDPARVAAFIHAAHRLELP